MILFTILMLMLLLLVGLTVAAISVGGTVMVVLFGDVIVCIVFIVLIMKRLIKKKWESQSWLSCFYFLRIMKGVNKKWTLHFLKQNAF